MKTRKNYYINNKYSKPRENDQTEVEKLRRVLDNCMFVVFLPGNALHSLPTLPTPTQIYRLIRIQISRVTGNLKGKFWRDAEGLRSRI